MKILLIDPPFYRILGYYNRYFPCGLTTLATFLKHNGFSDVWVYDADFNERPESIDYSRIPRKYPHYLKAFSQQANPIWQEVKNTIKRLDPDLVGISIWTTFAASSFYIANLVKKEKPACVVVMGGPHATVKANEILKICPDVDFVIRGQGEYPLLELVVALSKKGSAEPSVNSISFKKGPDIIHNPSGRAVLDLNRFPFPDRRFLINEKRYSSEDMGLLMTTRGCPYSCTYCATDTRQISYRSPDHILSEISFVKKHYGTTQFTFKDDSFTVNKQRVAALCRKLISDKYNIAWECNTRVNLLDENLLRLMRKAGCNFIKVGIESGSERILRLMNKGITHEQIRNAAQLFRKIGIHWTGYFMMGVPGETEADIRKTMDFLFEIKPDFASIGIYEPFPGTVMFKEGERRGLINRNLALHDFYNIYPNDYYKANPIRQTDSISQERFDMLKREFNDIVHDYNRNFSRVAKMTVAKSRVYLNDPKVLWDDFKKFLSY